jgi:flagellar protein FliO/FliZ
MTQVLIGVLAVAFVAAGVVALAFIVRKMMRGPALTRLLAPKSQRRLDIIEQAVIDPKRRLVLVRRDNVEHLIMIGGPVDVVIESGIGSPAGVGERRPVTGPPYPLGVAAE